MISNSEEYMKALEKLVFLETWLERVALESPGSTKGMTKAGIRKSIARLQEELGAYEGALEMAQLSAS